MTVLSGRAAARRDDHERLRRRLGLGDLRRREPALLSRASSRTIAVWRRSSARVDGLQAPLLGGRQPNCEHSALEMAPMLKIAQAACARADGHRAAVRGACARRASSRASSTAGGAARDLGPGARAPPRADRRRGPARDPRRRARRRRRRARVDPQGLPAATRCAGSVTHVDLQEVRLDQPIQRRSSVAARRRRDAPGVKEGGVLSQVARESTSRRCRSRCPSTSTSTSRHGDGRHAPPRATSRAGGRHVPRRSRDGARDASRCRRASRSPRRQVARARRPSARASRARSRRPRARRAEAGGDAAGEPGTAEG